MLKVSVILKHIFAIFILAFLGCEASVKKDDMTVTSNSRLSDADLLHLERVLAMQPDQSKARYPWRNPKETLSFFGIRPGDTVVEILPGRFWYSAILSPYIGSKGKLIGIDYDINMWSKIRDFPPAFIESRRVWQNVWIDASKKWGPEIAAMEGYEFSTLPMDKLSNQADYVIFIRALHNMARLENQGGYLSDALKKTYALLKPGGYLGIVQHQADESMPDSYATGVNGYMKKSKLKSIFENAGFKYIGESGFNNNPKDQPTIDENVWRLPPSLRVKAKDEHTLKKLEEIGESNRMTLLFQKVG